MKRRDPFCWEISNCAEHRRASCAAYRNRCNCWEVAGTPINSDNQGACENCPVILSRLARSIAEAVVQTQSWGAKR